VSYVVDGLGEFDSLDSAVIAARPATSLVAAMRRPVPRRRRALGEAKLPAIIAPSPAPAPQPITFNQALVLTGIVLFGLWALGAFGKGKA
jgi:hypothetical protein